MNPRSATGNRNITWLAVIAFGLVGYNRLSLELFPDITYPSITVQTDFPDTAPQEVENLITRPVEEAVGVLRGLQTIHSVSRAGISENSRVNGTAKRTSMPAAAIRAVSPPEKSLPIPIWPNGFSGSSRCRRPGP